MPNLSIIIGAFIGIIVMLIYFWLFNQIWEQYKKLKNPIYVNKNISSADWMGKPITLELIKKMSIFTSILAITSFLISIYILFTMGTNKGWAVLTAVGLILLYAASLWINYNR